MSDTTNIALLQQELKQLKFIVNEDRKRTIALENENEKLQEKLMMGKGILIGLIVATGSAGMFVVDYFRGVVSAIR